MTRLKKIVLAERDGRQLDTLSTLQVRLCARGIGRLAARDRRVLPRSCARQRQPAATSSAERQRPDPCFHCVAVWPNHLVGPFRVGGSSCQWIRCGVGSRLIEVWRSGLRSSFVECCLGPALPKSASQLPAHCCPRGSVSAPGIFFGPFPTRACFCPPPPPSPNNLEHLLSPCLRIWPILAPGL